MTHRNGSRLSFRLRVSLLGLALMLLIGAPAQAATFRVNTRADTTIMGGCTTASTCASPASPADVAPPVRPR